MTAVLVVGTELLAPDASRWGPGMSLPALLFLAPGGIVSASGNVLLWSNYPVLPWLELVTLGMVCGHVLLQDQRKAFGLAWKAGLAFLLAFAVVRILDGWGNIRPRMGNSWIDYIFLYAGIGHLVAPKGASIPAMVPFWLLGLLVLFPWCLWYGRLKQRQMAGWVLRFL